MLKTRLHQSPCNNGPPMTPNQLRFRASSQKDQLTTNSTGFTPDLEMTSRIKHLQHAKLHPSTRIANTKSMTPNQLRFRASGFKDFLHIPLGPCSGFKAKCHDFYFSFSSFHFLFDFSFLFHLEDYIGLHSWVTQTYYRSSTYLRPTFQSEKRYIASQPIGTIWCAVCELAKGAMFKVEYAGTSIDQKLNHAWNCSIIKVTYRASIFQLKARVET